MNGRLDVLHNTITECTKCALHKTRTKAVPGTGSEMADVMLVGEAPGRTEDAVGEPFVGAAGRMLKMALESAGSSREKVYITNVVKCRPPDNRVPNNKERSSCKSYLDAEMKTIKPKIICVMGNTAMGSLLGQTGIGKIRGKLCKMNGQMYFPTIHPAATLYNRELIKVLNSDIKRLFDIISQIKDGVDVKVDIEYD